MNTKRMSTLEIVLKDWSLTHREKLVYMVQESDVEKVTASFTRI